MRARYEHISSTNPPPLVKRSNSLGSQQQGYSKSFLDLMENAIKKVKYKQQLLLNQHIYKADQFFVQSLSPARSKKKMQQKPSVLRNKWSIESRSQKQSPCKCRVPSERVTHFEKKQELTGLTLKSVRLQKSFYIKTKKQFKISASLFEKNESKSGSFRKTKQQFQKNQTRQNIIEPWIVQEESQGSQNKFFL